VGIVGLDGNFVCVQLQLVDGGFLVHSMVEVKAKPCMGNGVEGM
jgi:hypothetical protein